MATAYEDEVAINTTADTEHEVQRALLGVKKRVKMARASFDQLRTRLAPILRDEKEEPAENVVEEVFGAPLAQAIRHEGDDLAGLCRSIESVLDRLEV